MKNRKLRDDMKYALRQHDKDKMSLANLKIKITTLRDRIRKLEREQEEIDMKYASVRKLIRKGTKIILDFTRKEELRR